MRHAQAIAELRLRLERIRAATDEALGFLDLLSNLFPLNPADLREEFRKLRGAGRNEREAVLQLALHHERTTKRILQILRTAEEADQLTQPGQDHDQEKARR